LFLKFFDYFDITLYKLRQDIEIITSKQHSIHYLSRLCLHFELLPQLTGGLKIITSSVISLSQVYCNIFCKLTLL